MLLERLVFQTKKSPEQLLAYSSYAGRLYKVFDIPKRDGGFRTIEQPSRALKALQRWLERVLFSRYMIHPAAMGYRKGISIRDNATKHASYQYTLRMDFKDFFWSFRREDVVEFFRRTRVDGIDLSEDDVQFVAGIATRMGRLVMGAPSSPVITNIMMFNIDDELHRISERFDFVYTRYADDLFFSGDIVGASREIELAVTDFVGAIASPNLSINARKTCHLSKRYVRKITGLVITPQNDVSLGRQRKKMIRSLLHSAIIGKLDSEELNKLSGHINWAKSVEPAFIESLRTKYGPEHVEKFSRSTNLRPISAELEVGAAL